MRFRRQREGAERVPVLVEQRFRRLLDFLCLFQMMPLLIAVAIAIVRFEAENFWMAWVM